ncbi:flagellin N-terminal helical domain-containing protein [Thermobrachium celere]|uniref:flagellin N-terminal helical domain-containing protein n=1 Tax=Thermobrachium celere TaxID=53422 RepID=UPI0019415190|nr:flagellin [Thermobrachium celere]GFR36113.1 flagellin [Thermobrachium celere]
MIINHNLNAMNAHRQLGINTVNAGKSMEKLSSGLRINRAGDDAAGLAISEKMRAQIRGLDQAARNSQDAISLIQTAEGALNETHSILQRMRELAVQASNGTATDDDRNAIQDEINQLISEIDRIGETTEFNTKKLLNGSQTQNVTITTNNSNIKSFTAFNAVLEGTDYNVSVANVSKAAANLNSAGNTGLQAEDITFSGGNYDVGDKIEIVVSDGSAAGLKNLTLKVNGVSIDTITNHDVTTDATFDSGNGYELTVAANSFNTELGSGNGTVQFDFAIEADYEITKGSATLFSATNLQTTDGNLRLGDFRATVDKTLVANATNAVTVNGKALEFQIGANENQTTSLSISDMRSAALGIQGLDVNDQVSAKAAISTIDNAIKKVSDERAKLGANQNRLEHTINNLGTSSENLQAAESRIRDVDMAKEMMTFSKNNILAQAAQAMLAQANQQPQGVLQLLR